ncbi:MAG: hypothetical protein ACQET7_10415 [Thermodesulfobacteriota bacterium]
MKCPKCGYVSFDHNQTCPKCNKGISEERNKLNLPHFEPAVPFLLGALTGEADEAARDIDIASPGIQSIPGGEEEIHVEEEIAPFLEEEEDVVSLDDDLDISMDEEWSPVDVEEEESVVAEEFPDIELDEGLREAAGPEEPLEDLGLDLEEVEEPLGGESDLELTSMDELEATDGEALSFDFDDLATEAGPAEEPAAGEESVIGPDEDLSLDLDELNVDQDELTGDITPGDASPTEEEAASDIDLDSIALGDEEEEVVLNLDDLKVNETGELEIGSQQMKDAVEEADASSLEETIDVDDMAFDEKEPPVEPAGPGAADVPEEDYDLTMDLGDLSLDEETASPRENDEEEFSLDMDDLELDLDLDLNLEEEEPEKTS